MNARANAQIISCPKCGAKNRVDPSADAQPVCGRCKTPLTAQVAPATITDRNFAEEVEKSALPFLLDMWAPWCGPCRIVGPTVDQLTKEFRGKVRVGKLNVDENQTTAARFNVQSIPTLLILKNGKEIDRIIGVEPKKAIAQRLQKYL
jgi:thioredoxin 2